MIGIFDSGLGGLTVARALLDAMPETGLIYLGDTARFPYGERSTGSIAARVDQGITFLTEKGARMILLACTASSAAWLLRSDETCTVPVVDAVTACVEGLSEYPLSRRVGVIGTEAAVREGLFEEMIRRRNPDAGVYALAAPLLVPLIAAGWVDRPETRMIVKKYLHPLKVKQVDALILGCNYYSAIKKLIQHKIGKRTSLVDGSSAVAAQAVKSARTRAAALGGAQGTRAYYLTDITQSIAATGKKLFGRHLTFRPCRL